MDVINSTGSQAQDQQGTHSSASPRLRIAHITTTAVGGGAAKVMLDLASAQRAAGHEVLSISIFPWTPPPAWFGAEHGDWNDIVHLDWRLRYDRPLNLWEAQRRLKVELEKFQPDVVHSHLWEADIVASLSIERHTCLHIAHLHNQELWKCSPAWKHRTRRSLTRSLYRRANTRFLACAEAVKVYEARHMQWPEGHIDVAQNSVDSKRFHPRDQRQAGRLRIGSAGWFVERKGHSQLIAAVATLASEGINLELVIAGEGLLQGDYLRQAADLGITDRLVLPGPVTDMVSFYQSLDIFALPSYEEGLALVVLEAMASGICVVASAIDGMDEAVFPEVNGLLFSVGDQLSLVSALRRVLVDGDLRSRMGTASRQIAIEKFSSAESAKKVEMIYRRRLAERSSCRPH